MNRKIRIAQSPFRKVLAMALAVTMLLAGPAGAVSAYADNTPPAVTEQSDSAAVDSGSDSQEGGSVSTATASDAQPDNQQPSPTVPSDQPSGTSPEQDSGTPAEEAAPGHDVSAGLEPEDGGTASAEATPSDASLNNMLLQDDAPPAFTSGYPKAGNMQSDGSRQLSVVISAQEPSYYHYVLLPDGDPAPDAQQVLDGLDAGNQPALKSASSNGTHASIDVGILVPLHDTDYDVYVVLEDDAGNLSDPARADVKSPPAADFLAATYPKAGSRQPNGSRQVEVEIQVQNTGNQGQVYWVLLPDGEQAPSIEQIGNGTDSNGNPPISSASPVFNNNEPSAFLVTGAADAANYDLYMVVGDTRYANSLGKCTDVYSLDVTTPEADNGAFEVAETGVKYATLDEALAAVTAGQTIRLLKNAIYEKAVNQDGAMKISGKNFTFDLNGFDMTIRNTGNGTGLALTSNANVQVIGAGKFNITSTFAALEVSSSAFASAGEANVSLESTLNLGINASYSASIEIQDGSIKGVSGGIYAVNNNTVTFNGPITVNGTGSNACHGVNLVNPGNTVHVGGNITITGGNGAGIYVEDGGIVTAGSQTAPVSVTGKSNGIWTRQGSNTADITVYGNVTGGARAIYATGDNDITVEGDVKSTSAGASTYAVEGFANSGDDISIHITGNVEGINGIKYHGNSGTVNVTGNVTATGAGSDTVGVYASYGSAAVTGNVNAAHGTCANAGENGQITIDGTLTGATYVKVYTVAKTIDDKTIPTTKAGYHTYSHLAATVWVKDDGTAANVCEIMETGTKYATLDMALAAAANGQTIKLLQNIDYTKNNSDPALRQEGKSGIFDLNGHTLTINNPSGDGIYISLSGRMSFTGGGALNINAKTAGLYLSDSSFASDAGVNVTIISSNDNGITASDATIDIQKGAVTGHSSGIHADQNNTITVNGPVAVTGTTQNHGVHLEGAGNTVTVGSAEVQSGSGSGVYVKTGGSVAVGSQTSPGAVTGKGNGIQTLPGSSRAYVTVYGNVTGSGAYGISAGDNAEIKVYGHVTSNSAHPDHCGVLSSSTSNGNLIEIHGNISGINGAYVNGNAAQLKVFGNVAGRGTYASTNYGVYANDGSAMITGDVTALGCIGAYADVNAQITVDGAITAAKYIKAGSTVKTMDDKTLPTTKAGYHTYSKETATVWVKDNAVLSGVCKIDETGVEYATLDLALAAAASGQTIQLLNSITRTASLEVDGKTINLKPGNHTLLIDTSANDANYALTVKNGGKILLSGPGTGAFNVKGRDGGIRILGANSEAAVNHVTVTGEGAAAIYMYGSGNALDGGKITVNGNITADARRTTAISVNAKNGTVTVNGNITAGQTGVQTATNAGTTVTVNGNITIADPSSQNPAQLKGIQANGLTSVTVTGDVTVRGVNCTGVYAYGGTIRVGGDVVSSGTGAKAVPNSSYGNGTVTIDGSLSAGSPFIVVGDSEKSAGENTIPTTNTGYLTYTDGRSVVWIGSAADTHRLTVQNGTGSGLYSAGTSVNITANAPAQGKVFDKWTTDNGGSFGNANSASTTFTMPSGAVTVTATYKDAPVTTYLLTVVNGTGGGTYTADAQVSITANAPAQGKVFDKWLTDNGGSFGNANSASTTFIMPSGAVTVTATYKDAPAETYHLTVNGSYADADGAGQYAPGTQIPIHAGSRSSYSFNGWTSSGGGSFANASSASTIFTMPSGNVTVTANWKYTGGSGGSSGGGGGGFSAPIKPTRPVSGSANIAAATVTQGTATVTVTEQNLSDAIRNAKDEAARNGVNPGDVTVVLNLTTGNKGAASVNVNLPKTLQDFIISQKIANIVVVADQPAIRISLDLAAVTEIKRQAGSDVNLTAARIDSKLLSAEAQNAIGKRPVFDLRVNYGNGQRVQDFGKGSATIGIPYTPQGYERTGNLHAVYVDANGKVQWLTNSSYDAEAKLLRFSTSHFSVYGVGYMANTPVFNDIANHWAKGDIEFVAARSLLNGTGANVFSPNTGTTRGMFVTALGRLAGINPDNYRVPSFTDVKADAYYAPYVEWAAQKNIIKGTGDKLFSPDSPVTRQEMAVIMVNYAKVCGDTVPKTREAVTFADKGSIASWAKDAVKAMQMAGVINGKDGNRFDPTGTATRAEVAALLHRYVELVIDPATAQGWTQNDAGQWLYYDNGKPVTGWKLADGKWYYLDAAGLMQSGGWKQIGGKWYYLYADGSMAVNMKIDGYEIGPDGARK